MLSAIVTHPSLVMLSNLVTSGDIVGLHIPSSGKLVTQALVDYSFMFLQASKNKILKSVCKFGINFSWLINWRKFCLISCIESDLECLGWRESVITRGSIY